MQIQIRVQIKCSLDCGGSRVNLGARNAFTHLPLSNVQNYLDKEKHHYLSFIGKMQMMRFLPFTHALLLNYI